MNWEEKIERLAARAQAERTPRVDVTQSVLHILASGEAAAPDGGGTVLDVAGGGGFGSCRTGRGGRSYPLHPVRRAAERNR